MENSNISHSVTVTSASLTGELGVEAELVEVRAMVRRVSWVVGSRPRIAGLRQVSEKESGVRVAFAYQALIGEPLSNAEIEIAPPLQTGAAHLDLPIVLGILAAKGVIPQETLDGRLVIGELAFDGHVRPVRGVLAAARRARAAGLRGVIVPESCAWEAALVDGITVYPVTHLSELVESLCGKCTLRTFDAPPPSSAPGLALDMADVRGDATTIDSIAIAIATGQRILLVGPADAGITMLARGIPTLLSDMTRAEALEVTQTYSAVGLAHGLIDTRPFRAPHHTISADALVGRRRPWPRLGELQLSRRGVLFLADLPEFASHTIQALANALDEMAPEVRPQIIASAQPCTCGWLNSGVRSCLCGEASVTRQQDQTMTLAVQLGIGVVVPVPNLSQRRDLPPGESSASIRARIAAFRAGSWDR